MLRLPVIRGVIDRRILVNYHVDPDVMARNLPAPFRPKLIHGYAVAGICLIRLRAVRPRFLPAPFGVSSENAAHRVAVEWDDVQGRTREGVYIPRRDSNSRLNTLAGGRVFPGIHHHATFDVYESPESFEIDIASDDGAVKLSVIARVSPRLPAGSIFQSVDEASQFFEGGSLGYSDTADANRFQGMALHCERWHMEPLEVKHVASSWFDDRSRFPAGTATFDCALLMREIKHEWHSHSDLCCPSLAGIQRPPVNASM
jgi:hypothetical protein